MAAQDAASEVSSSPEVIPIPADPDGITTSSLEVLQSDAQRKILDIVDDLRRQGLNGIVGLPQLVVCGDQSSGKSSVLEAITEIPFPRNANLCTRFATEIILRRSLTSSISIRIMPDKARFQTEQKELEAFKRTITDFTQLPAIIEEATAKMGLEEVGQGGSAFAKDVLTVEISGPNRPQLTLVDLPGLIHSSNKMQTEEDVELIKDLVLEYMRNSRTIILAVISAKNDYANQIILKHCRSIDPKGSRTMGIITKPDDLIEGTKNQQTWLDLAQNRDTYFQLGWHMVKNRSETEGHLSFVQRNLSERQFFSRGRYAELDYKNKGIETLRTKLSNVLHNHLKTELPQLRAELMEKLEKTTKDLYQLGIKRSTVIEQRMFLTDIGQKINDIVKSAIRGQYENDFFGQVNMNAAVDSKENIRRFRAVVQHLNLQFAEQMHKKGHKYTIPSHCNTKVTAVSVRTSVRVKTPVPEQEPVREQESDDAWNIGLSTLHKRSKKVKKRGLFTEDTPLPETTFSETAAALLETTLPEVTLPKTILSDIAPPKVTLTEPIEMTRDEGINWVHQILERSRGLELPGNFNPLIISQLFWEQSTRWNGMALQHIEKVSDNCKAFVDIVFDEAAPKDIKSRLSELCVDVELDRALSAAKEELSKIIEDKSRHPMTYNHYFTTKIQDQRKSKYAQIFSNIAKGAQEVFNIQSSGFDHVRTDLIDPDKLHESMATGIEQNMDRFSAEDALDSQIAYYADELKYFIDCVTKQVIERHLVDPLSRTVLSPRVIAGLTDEQISLLAAEAPEVSHQRVYLEGRKQVLENGLKIFKEALGGFS